MTVDEIKRSYSMRDVLSRYGIHPNRSGFIPCPFHNETAASMKIYKDSYYCYGCHRAGDIFKFIQEYENCDFKTAFYSLGGEYEKDHRKTQINAYKFQKAREKREKEIQKIKDSIDRNNYLIHASRELFNQCEPLSDYWWHFMDIYHMAIIKDINMEGGVKEIETAKRV